MSKKYPQWLKFLLATVGIGTFFLLGKKTMEFKSKAEWAKYIFDSIDSVIPELYGNLRAKLIITAHAAYESGWGGVAGAVSASHLKQTNNIFNLTCGASWTGPRFNQANADDEYAPDGTYKGRISQCWRSYPSQLAALADYWKFLDASRYASRGVKGFIKAGDVVGFSQALFNAGYFTLPVNDYYKDGVLKKGYATSLNSIVNTVIGFVK